MTLLGFLILLLIAAVCGGIGQALDQLNTLAAQAPRTYGDLYARARQAWAP